MSVCQLLQQHAVKLRGILLGQPALMLLTSCFEVFATVRCKFDMISFGKFSCDHFVVQISSLDIDLSLTLTDGPGQVFSTSIVSSSLDGFPLISRGSQLLRTDSVFCQVNTLTAEVGIAWQQHP